MGDKNPLVYAVTPGRNEERFENGYGSATFSGGSMRLDYLRFWRDWTEKTRDNQCDDFDIDEQDEDELENILMAAEEGNTLAVLDGVYFCQARRCPLPSHLVKLVEDVFRSYITGKSPGKRGRGNTPSAREQDRANVDRRINTVDRIIWAREMYPEGLGREELDGFVANFALPSETVALLKEGSIKSLGSSIDDAIEIAAKSLRGTAAQCSKETLRRQYYETSDFNPSEYVVSQKAVEAIGIEGVSTPAAFEGAEFMDMETIALEQWGELPDVK